MKAPKIGIGMHIPGNKKGKVAALKKPSDARVPANSCVTAQPPKEKACCPVFMPCPHMPMDEWLCPCHPMPEGINMACIKACKWCTHLRCTGTAADGP